tara:strand:- start:3661 stop:5976 length:2316 start_codon:yes stop_codon:yes gene_type:complete
MTKRDDLLNTKSPSNKQEETSTQKRFGTFLGVFTPSILTILGVMMYLRFGWVVGNVGLWRSLMIVFMASSITFITALSASAISTNMRVGIGGEYYMISRSLGLELGGAIGIPLFLCRTLSITLYAFGLAEALSLFWPVSWGPLPMKAIAAAVIVLITFVAGKSAELTLKLQVPIMMTVFLSLIALALGGFGGGVRSVEWGAHYARSAPGGFWFVFAVFFPAVTGFTAGIGMSGDLKDPQRSIPRGTMAAVVLGTVIYLLILVLLAVTGKVSGSELANLDPNVPPIWTKIAMGGAWLVAPGMLGAILSSAFGSVLGGPRVLQALSLDKMAPGIFAKTSDTGQPTYATWFTGGIALFAVLLGDLNAVGKWVTIFFLTLYVSINLAAGVERIVRDPSYRPTIQVHWGVSFLGVLGAITVMFLISPIACVGALLLEVALYFYLNGKALESHWGDVRTSLWTALTRLSLLQMRRLVRRARHWRPNILVFVGEPKQGTGLVRLANWLNQNRGIVSVTQAIKGDLEAEDIHETVQEHLQELEAAIAQERMTAFAEVDVVAGYTTGFMNIIQAHGFAGMQSNIVMFGWPHSTESFVRVLRVMRVVSRLHKQVFIARIPEQYDDCLFGRIDVWWRGEEHNAELMLLMSYLLQRNTEWLKAKVVLRTIVDDVSEQEAARVRSCKTLSDARIVGDVDVIVRDDGTPIEELIHRRSHDADIVFFGMVIPEAGEEEAYAQWLETLAKELKQVVFFRNAGPFMGKLLAASGASSATENVDVEVKG